MITNSIEPYGDVDLKMLQELTEADGISGCEKEVSRVMKKYLENYADEISYDNLGSIIGLKKGEADGPRVMIAGHMDEVGFIITGFNKDGTLRFSALGGVNSKIIPSKVVLIGENKIPGVIGIKPIHLQGKEERKNGITYRDCAIDIGAKDE